MHRVSGKHETDVAAHMSALGINLHLAAASPREVPALHRQACSEQQVALCEKVCLHNLADCGPSMMCAGARAKAAAAAENAAMGAQSTG